MMLKNVEIDSSKFAILMVFSVSMSKNTDIVVELNSLQLCSF